MRTERFIRAYDALVKAFFEGTLAKGTCVACACGNIMAAACGVKLTPADVMMPMHKWDSYPHSPWQDDRTYDHSTNSIGVIPEKGLAKKLTKSGYSVQELCHIENAFENNSKIIYERYPHHTEQEILEDQYNGLAAVVDVLLKLDNISPEDHYKNKFREHPQLV